ncbi:hypothetical protein CLTEP_02540 [Clostridium tepidiprofundi DSM 19306]|uniref:DUF1540 domain-containing protein n=1 Tax=Clostridium tepidiprofundi DSM 19306 TaxID=1121338 RepID=A0A151B7D7_9CLOT|nr:hypothetical protein [Clostridium tepidiprofundi]KYH35861.1 hypothetical protein CLTEP_02540 [Clostridium tepidiprofundi DSM 19306]
MGFIHCQNDKCKYYWEDMCTLNMKEKLVCLDKNGKCFSFEEGISEWYKEAEESEKEN